MFTITYLEEKVLTRESFKLAIELQESCKVIYSSAQVEDYCTYYKQAKQPPDLCIIADSYNYLQIVQVIRAIKASNTHTYILLKSDAKFMKAICYLMKNGLNGIFFTDEPLIDLKKMYPHKNTI